MIEKLEHINQDCFFEGTEKLLEIWFKSSLEIIGGDLRNIPRFELDAMLKIVNAEIVSVKKNEFIDSYVLSESSMFISKDRFIIKTCGIITLLESVQQILRLAEKYGKMSIVQNFFYSRRAYLRPNDQIGIHKTFNEEVNYLKLFIPYGAAYSMGLNESSKWYLFTTDNPHEGPQACDATLEILMSDLDEETMLQFTKIKNPNSEELIRNTGISKIIPGSVNDGLVFDPMGFSLNSLFRESYYTIHVTPQPFCSYVSFETNIHLKDYDNLINRVLRIFKPGNFIITFFQSKVSSSGTVSEFKDKSFISGYVCDDTSNMQLKNYSCTYMHYVSEKCCIN
ncbi:S-adenosylmethionine decarboxylase proenzyme 2 isoform X1 [Hydra vulgaris]|uniref:S-adenosylmethionine decarboxylase proenzyme n=1 Tax=Hydra vulgaris TaxID=6087 RepID=T2MH94_HYDVU|nr:S-adenosylmethionine decarboxylase proenzyme 2 [Hydra vulgaris]